jgi:predicted Zn-dependent protease with MMP-like domain
VASKTRDEREPTTERRDRSRIANAHRRRFERLLGVAIRHLPADFTRYLDNVAILVADAPSRHQREASGLADDEVLFGLYEGVPLTQRSTAYGSVLPDRITLFRRAFEATCDGEAAIIEEIRRTILHEVGHHVGFGEDRLKDV